MKYTFQPHAIIIGKTMIFYFILDIPPPYVRMILSFHLKYLVKQRVNAKKLASCVFEGYEWWKLLKLNQRQV